LLFNVPITTLNIMNTIDKLILDAVESRFDEQIDFLTEVSGFDTTRGKEQEAQKFMNQQLQERGYSTDMWEIKVDDISGLPGFSPVLGDYNEALNVVGTSRSEIQKGKSLILNGHIDVVPAGPLDMWQRPPFDIYCEDHRI